MGYTNSAIKGVSWMSGARFINRILTFVKIAVLARVLTPTQFGVFGIATLLLALLEILTETGINVVLVQIKIDIDEYIDSAWIVSIIRGALISLAIIISSPFIASFFHTQAALNILLFISLVPLVRGFVNPSEVKFQKELLFKYQFIFNTFLILIDASTSIIVAYFTHSVYSLVVGLLSSALLEILLSFLFIKPRPKFAFKINHVKEIFHKGKWVTAYSIFNYFGQNGDNIVVGRVLGASPLGIYAMAYNIAILPISEIADVVSQVVFPVFSKIESDRQRLKLAFLKTIGIISAGTIFLGGIIFLFPREIVIIVLGSQWLSAVTVLKVLAVYGILRAISGTSSAMFLGAGKQKYVTAITLTRSAALMITIFPLVFAYGIIGAAYSALFSVLVEIPVITYLVIRTFKEK